MEQESITELLALYREAAVGTGREDSAEQNKWADKVHACYKLLHGKREGREGIMALMTDSNPDVRLWAASHSLEWSPVDARLVLEAIRDEESFPRSFTAQITLEEFDKGSLSFEY